MFKCFVNSESVYNFRAELYVGINKRRVGRRYVVGKAAVTHLIEDEVQSRGQGREIFQTFLSVFSLAELSLHLFIGSSFPISNVRQFFHLGSSVREFARC